MTMKRTCTLVLAVLPLMAMLAGCPSKSENKGAPTPPPIKVNGQNAPSEGAHYMQQMQQQGKPVPGNNAAR